MAIELILRPPTIRDGADLWRLATATEVLDVNSAYAYTLWCRDFAATSIVAARPDRGGSDLRGFVTGYRRPDAPDTLFVWQVAVDDRVRRQGVAARLITELFERLSPHGVERIEATVAPSNAASLQLFRTVAQRFDAPCTYPAAGGFGAGDLPEDHEEEPLLVIGPVPRSARPDLSRS